MGERWTVPLLPATVNALAAHLARRNDNASRFGRHCQPSGHLLCDNTDLSTFVFTGATGRPLDYSHTRARIWLPALQRARLPDPAPTWHDLRHSYATWLIAGGADVGTVRDVLGHESLVVTNRYTHARPDAAAAVLRALSR